MDPRSCFFFANCRKPSAASVDQHLLMNNSSIGQLLGSATTLIADDGWLAANCLTRVTWHVQTPNTVQKNSKSTHTFHIYIYIMKLWFAQSAFFLLTKNMERLDWHEEDFGPATCLSINEPSRTRAMSFRPCWMDGTFQISGIKQCTLCTFRTKIISPSVIQRQILKIPSSSNVLSCYDLKIAFGCGKGCSNLYFQNHQVFDPLLSPCWESSACCVLPYSSRRRTCESTDVAKGRRADAARPGLRKCKPCGVSSQSTPWQNLEGLL